MPVKKCKKGGKVGEKWGDHGTCYTGPDAHKKMLKQMRAIKASQARRKAGG